MAKLSRADAEARMPALEGWTLGDAVISREFTFRDFPEAVLFVSALVPGAEDVDHHPDIEIHYRKVVVSYTTHSEGGLTEKDFAGAAVANEVAANLSHLTDFAAD